MSGKSVPPTPWKPCDLPTLRAAYSDRTAALMAYLAAFAYDTRIEAKGMLQVPQELSAFGFDKLTSFHNGMTDGCYSRFHRLLIPFRIVALYASNWLWVSPLSSPSSMHWKTETYSVNHNFVC